MPGPGKPTRRVLACAALILLGACAADVNGPFPALTGDAAAPATDVPLDRTLRLAAAARGGGDLASAVRLYRRAVERHPEALRPYIELGDTLHAQGNYHEAIKTFDAAAARAEAAGDPRSAATARTGTGRALLGLHRPAEALAPLAAALERAPDHRVARNARAVALDALGRHGEAQAIYRALLEANDADALAQANLGLSLAIAGDHDAAIATLDDLVGRENAGARARQNLAIAYALAGDYDAARAVMRADLGERAVEDNIVYLDTVRGLLASDDAGTRRQGRRTLNGGAR